MINIKYLSECPLSDALHEKQVHMPVFKGIVNFRLTNNENGNILKETGTF